MARPKRLWHPDSFYHVTIRGNNRQDIFQSKADMREYFRIQRYVYEKYQFEIFAYCIMNNHNHLLLRSPEVPLGKLMAILNKRYSDYYRKKYDYTGQIYENRYYSREINDPIGLLNVSAYIHRNPIETKTPMVTAMEHYSYSSYKYYYYNNYPPYPFLNLQLLPSFMPVKQNKRKAYTHYCIQYKQKENSVPGTHTTPIQF